MFREFHTQNTTKNNSFFVILGRKLTKHTKPKGVDAFHFVGKINLNKDALSIQKSLRDEWK